MPIEYISGDLFANCHHAQAFAHGCNCQGAMGAGIAVGFRERYPAMYEEYRCRCKAEPRQFNLGDVFLWRDEQHPWVFNLGTQERYWRGRASYDAIETALTTMRQQADAEAIQTIAFHRQVLAHAAHCVVDFPRAGAAAGYAGEALRRRHRQHLCGGWGGMVWGGGGGCPGSLPQIMFLN